MGASTLEYAEVVASYRSTKPRTVSVPGQGGDPLPSRANAQSIYGQGGGDFVSFPPKNCAKGRLFTWTHTEDHPCVVEVRESSPSEDLDESVVLLEFPSPIQTAHACVGQCPDEWWVLYVLTQDGCVHRLQVLVPSDASTLALSQVDPASVESVDVREEIVKLLAHPTAVFATPQAMLVGGASGDVLRIARGAMKHQGGRAAQANLTVFKDPLRKRMWSGLLNLGLSANPPNAQEESGRAVEAVHVTGDARVLVLQRSPALRVHNAHTGAFVSSLALPSGGGGAARMAVSGEVVVVALEPPPPGALDSVNSLAAQLAVLHLKQGAGHVESPVAPGARGVSVQALLHLPPGRVVEVRATADRAWLLVESASGHQLLSTHLQAPNALEACHLAPSYMSGPLSRASLFMPQGLVEEVLQHIAPGSDGQAVGQVGAQMVHELAQHNLLSNAALQDLRPSSLPSSDGLQRQLEAFLSEAAWEEARSAGAAMQRWGASMAAYLDSWTRAHRPLGLALSLDACWEGAVGVVRRGALCLISEQPQDLHESSAVEVGGAHVLAAAALVPDALGPGALVVLDAAVRRGAGPLDGALATVCAEATGGACLPADASWRSEHHAAALSQRARRLRALPLAVLRALRPLEDVHVAVRETLAALEWNPCASSLEPRPAHGSAPPAPSSLLGGALPAGLAAVARHRYIQARNVLLLLEYLIAAFPSQFACLSALVPKAKQAMLQVGVVGWMAAAAMAGAAKEAPLPRPAPSTASTASDLTRLHLTPGARWQGELPANGMLTWQSAWRLAGDCGPCGLARSVHVAASLVRWGDGPEREEDLPTRLLSALVLDVNMTPPELQVVVECAEAWLEAAPGAASAALQQAVQFAKGWYLLVKDPKDSGGEWAAQALLRALPAPGGAPHRHVASLLRSLPGGLGGEGPVEGQGAFAAAVVGILEARPSPAAARLFAYSTAHLQSVEAAETGRAGLQPAHRLSHWVMKNSVRAGQWHEAYTAALTQPQRPTRNDQLRSLVHSLMQHHQVAVLVGLPWAGESEEVLVDTLTQRARLASPHAVPNGHWVLHAVHVQRGNFRAAATAVAALAARLSLSEERATDARLVLEEEAVAWEASLAALSLLDPPPGTAPRHLDLGAWDLPHAALAPFADEAPGADMAGMSETGVRERARLARARLLVLSPGASPSCSLQVLVTQLVEARHFDAAVAVCKAWGQGSGGRALLESVFAAWAAHCLCESSGDPNQWLPLRRSLKQESQAGPARVVAETLLQLSTGPLPLWLTAMFQDPGGDASALLRALLEMNRPLEAAQFCVSLLNPNPKAMSSAEVQQRGSCMGACWVPEPLVEAVLASLKSNADQNARQTRLLNKLASVLSDRRTRLSQTTHSLLAH